MSQHELSHFVKQYSCDAATNNAVYQCFTNMTESRPFLFEHRQHIEKYKLGFGDRAFHYMWFLILQHLSVTTTPLKLLEIGVYKGQVISLWALLAKQLNINCDITCITPLSGNEAPVNRYQYYWNMLTSSKFRHDVASGNLYHDENYLDAITGLFGHFNLSVNDVCVLQGLSTDTNILSRLQNDTFDLVYIDGDHARKVVEQDIRNYAPKINRGGILVMDDASCNIPGGENGVYWKGHQSVSDACDIIPHLGFDNLLNIGHNRIFQRTLR